MRPARDSETPFTNWGDALPSKRKRASLSRAVHQHAQRLEERRHPLDFVDDYEAGQPSERLLGCGEAPPVDGCLQVEECGPGGFGGDLSRKRGLAALPRTGERGAGMDFERLLNASGGHWPGDEHALMIILENPPCK